MHLPPGCHFNDRCPHAFDKCRTTHPALRELGGGRMKSCHLEAAP